MFLQIRRRIDRFGAFANLEVYEAGRATRNDADGFTCIHRLTFFQRYIRDV